MFSELIKKIDSFEDRIRKLEIQNSAMGASLNIIGNALDIKPKGVKK